MHCCVQKMCPYVTMLNCINIEFLLYLWFRPKLKEHMQYCVEHPEEVSKLAQVKAQVSEVQQVMKANIDQVYTYATMSIP